MNPKYKFYLDGSEAHPVWSENLAKVYARADGEMFFRASLNGALRFIGSEYSYITGKVFDWVFRVVITYSTDGGTIYNNYWTGTFKKEDCKVDMDSQTVEVTPKVEDAYTKILESIDKVFNLVNLEPRMQSIRAARRPALQLYVAGQSTIFNFVSGMYWEASCTSESDNDTILGFNFARITNKLVAVTDQTGGMPEIFEGTLPATPYTAYTLTSASGYKFRYNPQAGQYGQEEVFAILDANDTMLYYYHGESDYSGYPRELSLPPVGSGSAITVSVRNLSVYSRLLLDTEVFPGTTHISLNDIAGVNTNYRFVCPYSFSDTRITYSTALSNTPTKYGLYEPNKYYARPTGIGIGELFPLTPSAWGKMSIWVEAQDLYDAIDQNGRNEFFIKDAYPLGAAINAILTQIDPMLYFSEGSGSSQFLYGNTAIESNLDKRYFIVPKTNITNSHYDNPAQRGDISLRQIFDMLRDTMRCYWYIDSGTLHIEHIEWFRRGGSYTGSPTVGEDLTTDKTVRNNKKWAFGLNKYSYNKADIPGRYTFGWMDSETEPFDGYPIEMINTVTLQPRGGHEETINIQNFSADLDYLMLNPNEVSKDGFVILKAGEYDLIDANNPITLSFPNGTYIMQELYSYEAMPNEKVWVKITHTRGFPSPTNTLQLFAADENGNILGALSDPDPSWDASVPRIIELPQGTKKIMARCNGGTVELFSFISNDYLSVLYYDYYPDGNGTARHRLMQNGEVSFAYMQRYYIYDMPSSNYEINGCYWYYQSNTWVLMSGTGIAQGLKRTKRQEVSYPSEDDPDTELLIKTDLGSGNIEDITVNLSSRNAKVTLAYDPT